VPPGISDVRSNGKEEAIIAAEAHVAEEDCVGCRLCFNVCPVDNCISQWWGGRTARAPVLTWG